MEKTAFRKGYVLGNFVRMDFVGFLLGIVIPDGLIRLKLSPSLMSINEALRDTGADNANGCLVCNKVSEKLRLCGYAITPVLRASPNLRDSEASFCTGFGDVLEVNNAAFVC
jgi:hypothetical protein